MEAIFDDGALPQNLTPEEKAQYGAEKEILRTKDILHRRLEGTVAEHFSGVLRKVSVSRHSLGNFYYRIIDNAVDQEGKFLGEIAREGYDSNDLRAKPLN